MENIIFVLCEGKHDVAFLSRLLKEMGLSSYTNKKLINFPEIVKGYFDGILRSFTYESEKDIFQRPQLPNAIYNSNNTWFIFYRMEGDAQYNFTKQLISKFNCIDDIFSTDEQFNTQQKVSLIFFFDADENIEKRKKKFIDTYHNEVPLFARHVEDDQNGLSSFRLTDIDSFNKIGLFIFSEGQSSTLEDIVIPLMKSGNERIFEDATLFLDTHEPNLTRSKKGKAQIGVVGQLKHQGKSNEVIIQDTPMITSEKILENPQIQSLIVFFRSFV